MSLNVPNFPRIGLEGGLDYIDSRLKQQGKLLKPFRYTGPVGKKGKWDIHPFNVEGGIAQLRYVRDGGRGMAPGMYFRLIRWDDHPFDAKKKKPTLVMSDTDAEIIDFLGQCKRIEGDVLVGGLGMGLVVKAMMQSPDVKHITVVELSQDLIDLVGPYVKDPRVTVVQGDIFKWTPPRNSRYDWAWLDIWDEISDDNLPDFKKLRARYSRYMDGKNRVVFWCEKECKKLAAGVDPRSW